MCKACRPSRAGRETEQDRVGWGGGRRSLQRARDERCLGHHVEHHDEHCNELSGEYRGKHRGEHEHRVLSSTAASTGTMAGSR